MTTEKQAGMPDEIYAYHDGYYLQLADFKSTDEDVFKTYTYIRRDIVTPEAAVGAYFYIQNVVAPAFVLAELTEDERKHLETIRALLIAHGGVE